MMRALLDKAAYLRRYAQRNAFVFGNGFTLLRFINFLLIEIQGRIGTSFVIGRPWSIFLDPVNACVLHCPLCGTGLGQEGRPRHLLSYDEFVRYVSPLTPFLYIVKLYNYGEPFLNPDLCRMIEYLHRRRIIVQVNSNLNRLSETVAEQAIEAGLDRLVVSFDGYSQEAYASYRRGGDVALVKANIAMVNAIKQRHQSTRPRIVLQYLVTRHNEHEYETIRGYAAGVAADFFPQPITIDITSEEQRTEWLPLSDAYSLYDRVRRIKKKTRPDRRCGFLWNDPVINVDGGLSPCCHLYFKETDFGNLNTHRFSEIWNNRLFREARSIFRDQTTSGKTVVCGRCVDDRAFTSADVDLINEHKTNNLK
jgi:radical SAM protein with 4Fe4S-binding SPASM domain